MGEKPIRDENKRTITENLAKFLLEQACDPNFADYYDGDLDRVIELGNGN